MGPGAEDKDHGEQVAERVILAIAYGEQQPGDRVTEGDLAEAMNVSRAACA